MEALATGDPLDETVKMGPMIREPDAVRVSQWVEDAVESGARLVTGGDRVGTMHAPTVVADVDPKMRISCDELFGPAVALTRFDSIDEAIAMANDTNYGLSAALFTENINWAMKFVRKVHSGNLMVNWGPQWRADLMPYGGLKESGMGKGRPQVRRRGDDRTEDGDLPLAEGAATTPKAGAAVEVVRSFSMAELSS